MTSASNERQIKERKRRAAEDARVEADIVRVLMQHPDGRRWVWLRLSEAQLFIGDTDLDPYRMAFMKGMKQFALKLLQAVNRHCPQEYVTMTVENTSVSLEPSSPEEEEAHVH